MSRLDELWSDPAWRECFRLANGTTARGVLGYTGRLDFDVLRADVACNDAPGEEFGLPWLAGLRLNDRYALISGRCDVTLDNGSDEWPDDSVVDVQIAATHDDLVRLAMTAEERERLGCSLGG